MQVINLFLVTERRMVSNKPNVSILTFPINEARNIPRLNLLTDDDLGAEVSIKVQK